MQIEDPILAHMRRLGMRITAANYLKVAQLDEPVPAEIEAELPDGIRRPEDPMQS